MASTVLLEAGRCLNCKVPRCRKGCPINTNIPEMIQLLLDYKIDEAGLMLFANNPMSVMCSLVCNHEAQCEGHCILGLKGNPVKISEIENYISDYYLDKLDVTPVDHKGIKAAVIGAGPAGLTIAMNLQRRGYEVTVFDQKDKIGGVLQYGIPEFRLPKSILERYKAKVLEAGIKLRFNTTIGDGLTIFDLQRDGYKAIFIGTGVWRPKTLGIPGESFGNVHFAIDYLANPASFELGKKVIILGAGNSAMDVARTALRRGAKEVTLFARRNAIQASKHELEYTLLDGASIEYGKQVLRITEEGAVFVDSQMDEEGNIMGWGTEETEVKADSVIVAVSQNPRNKLVSTTPGLQANDKGLLIVDEVGSTTLPGIFAAGDVVHGAKTVVEAANWAKKVADAMDDYMMKTVGEETEEASKINLDLEEI